MKAPVMAALAAAAAAALASPAQALTPQQEECIERIPASTQDAFYQDFLAENASGPGHRALVRAAEACADQHKLPRQKWAAYASYAMSTTIIRASQKQLVDAGYRLDLLEAGLGALTLTKGGAANVFDRETGLTQETVNFLTDFFARRSARFKPADDALVSNLNDLIFSLADIVAVAGELDLDLD